MIPTRKHSPLSILILLAVLFWALAFGVLTSCGASYSDEELLAAVLIAEAGGEGEVGIRAVYEVIQNRVIERDLTPAQVVRQRFQFSCLNNTNEAALVARASTHLRWGFALRTVREGWAGDLVRGATHYHTSDLNPRPFWSRGVEPVVTIGNHHFFKL
jgi:spore germination cell wall hydrolase CwlJ-like protein